MADFKKPNHRIIESFHLDPPPFSRPNTRIGVRYIREDIAAAVCTISLFGLGFVFNQEVLVELLDISSKGLLIATDKKLRVNQKINVFLRFDNNRVFRRQGKVVRRADGPAFRYGVQFDRLSNSLGEYLLATQKKLIFK